MARISPHDPVAREVARRIRAQQIRRRRLVLLLVVLGIVALVVILVAIRGCGGGATSTEPGGLGDVTAAMYAATLTGGEQVPPVDTNSTGVLRLTVDPSTSTVNFVLEVDGLINTSAAYIYEGEPGESGRAVVKLFDGPTVEGPHVGVIAEGPIREADLMGSLEGKTPADLILLVRSGLAYVSVDNTSYPDGAIRGQLE
ncbi:MAG: CHRD domain-containing protein [Actinobacteria bacterium]|nr:CHRD domain-containing protein [Actinomycetota bacterium]